jgi:predicted tellurium resistance membrane protein TerC
MHWLTSPEALISLVTLTFLEIVLGIDNIIFIAILVGRLPKDQQQKGRMIGLAGAMVMRVLLLLSLSWIMRLTQPLFKVASEEISGRDLILIVGGLFLLFKATREIHHKMEEVEAGPGAKAGMSFGAVIAQIMALDIVFSLDSVITAVGMANHIEIMILAVVISVAIMMWAARPISDFVHDHPTVKMLALSFLLLIGMSLMAEGLEFHIPKGYIYFAMAFSAFVEWLNLRTTRARKEANG